VLQARDNLFAKLIRDKPAPPKEIAEGSVAPFKPRFEDGAGAAGDTTPTDGGVARDATPTDAGGIAPDQEDEDEEESEEEDADDESGESEEDDADEESGESEEDDADDEAGEVDDADLHATDKQGPEEGHAGPAIDGVRARKKKRGKNRKGFYAKGAFKKMGYRSTLAERKRKEQKRLDNLDSFDAAASAYRGALAFAPLSAATKMNFYKFWKTSLKQKLRELRRIKKRMTHLRKRSLFYDVKKKKLQKIFDRNNYRADRHIFKMNFSVFGSQGLSRNHKGAMKFFLTMKNRTGFWANRANRPDAISPADSPYPSAEEHSDVTSEDIEEDDMEFSTHRRRRGEPSRAARTRSRH
jgi:hypothetical protein